jgi:hypothetical protein
MGVATCKRKKLYLVRNSTTIKPLYKSKLARNPKTQKEISLKIHAHPKHSQILLKFYILLVHCVISYWDGTTNDVEEGKGAKCKRI